jgi:hypothetical protein
MGERLTQRVGRRRTTRQAHVHGTHLGQWQCVKHRSRDRTYAISDHPAWAGEALKESADERGQRMANTSGNDQHVRPIRLQVKEGPIEAREVIAWDCNAQRRRAAAPYVQDEGSGCTTTLH